MLYVIKVNIILALLCLLFQVVMHRDTFFGVRRAMLWGIYLTAFLLPLCDVQSLMQGDATTMQLAADYATYVLPTLDDTATRVAAMSVQQEEPGCGMWFVGMIVLWGIIYLVPVAWMTLKFLWQIVYMIYLRCTCKREGAFFRYPRPCSPFSFGPWIFLHPDGMDEQTMREVLIHEQTHVRQWHTADILFSQLVCILFWWNPAAWIMRREVRMNLEFIADKAVSDALSPSPGEELGMSLALKAYQYRLLGFTTQKNVATIANNFNVLPLKRRIKMMNLRRTRRTEMVKYILFVPIAAALLLLSNVDALARTIADEASTVGRIYLLNGRLSSESEINQHKDIVKVRALDLNEAQEKYGQRGLEEGVVEYYTRDALTSDDKIYTEVEQMPNFPGGDQILYKWLAEHIKYPAVAQEAGIQGQTFVSFVVEKDGSISEVSAHRTADQNSGHMLAKFFKTTKRTQPSQKIENGEVYLDKEVMRVVSSMPRWKPGLQDGKLLRVRYILPVTFRLQ